MLAQKLRSAPNELQTSVEAKRGGKIITGLGSYSLGADAVRPSKDNTKIYIFPEFKYDPDTLRQVFGSTYKMSANDTPKTLSNDIVAKLGFTDHINFLVGSNSISSDTEAMKQACVRDMSAIVEQAKNHAGWLLGESTEVSPAELIGAENTYATRPFTPKGPANDPSVVNIYVAAVLPTTDGKGTIAQVTCGMEESSAASTAKPTASATSTG
ncbi:MAG: hypothetical protein WAW63_00190 [Candidatus Saccharimonadales bacterium]|jgi:hypothetical protein